MPEGYINYYHTYLNCWSESYDDVERRTDYFEFGMIFLLMNIWVFIIITMILVIFLHFVDSTIKGF